MVTNMTVDPLTTSETSTDPGRPSNERAAITERIIQEARRIWASHGVPLDLLDQYAREAVDALWVCPPKVTTYVPMLALRRIRERLAEQRG